MFLEWAEATGADKGRPDTRRQIAAEISDRIQAPFSVAMLDRVIRLLKEQPEYGISITLRRGREPNTVVSWDKGRLDDPPVRTVEIASDRAGMENVKRTIRSAGQAFVHYENVRDKRTAAARFLRRVCIIHRSNLAALQSALPTTDEGEAVSIWIDEVLAAFPNER